MCKCGNDVVQIGNKLRRHVAPVLLSRRHQSPCILHHGKREPGMRFSFFHQQLCTCVLQRGGRAVPIHDRPLNAAAHHVFNLLLDLRRIVGAVSDIHVAAATEPRHVVGIDLGARAGIEKRVDWHLAHISRSNVAIGSPGEGVRGGSVVADLRLQSCRCRRRATSTSAASAWSRS